MEVVGDAFLWKMVRHMVRATLTLTGQCCVRRAFPHWVLAMSFGLVFSSTGCLQRPFS